MNEVLRNISKINVLFSKPSAKTWRLYSVPSAKYVSLSSTPETCSGSQHEHQIHNARTTDLPVKLEARSVIEHGVRNDGPDIWDIGAWIPGPAHDEHVESF